MKAGFSRECITPKMGVSVSGYYKKRNAKGVLDDLYVSVASFCDGERKAVILGVDTLVMSSRQCDKYRKYIAEKCRMEETGIFINCSHTHTGPSIDVKPLEDNPGDSEYEEFLLGKMADAAMFAFDDMKDATLFAADGKAENISFVRRYKMKNGKTQTNPGVGNTEIDHALGVVNEQVKLLKVVRDGGDDIYIVNFGTHADTIGGEMISGDWPGFVTRTLEKALDGVKCVFLTGAQGDVNHINPNPTAFDRMGLDYDTFDSVPRSYSHARHMGQVVAGVVLQICEKAVPVNAEKINYETIEVVLPSNQDNSRIEEAERIMKLHLEGRDGELPYEKMELTTVVAEARRIIALQNGPDSFAYTLSGLKIGDAVFLGTPGELFTEVGRRIQKSSPFENTFVCCLTNGGDTYFPTSSAYDEGGYEARTSFLKKGGDNIIVDGATKLFNKLNEV